MNKIFYVITVLVFSCLILGLVPMDYFLSRFEDRPIAIVKRFKPNVNIKNGGEDKDIWLNVEKSKGQKLFSGDTLSTDDKGYALVTFMDNSVAKVKPQSSLIIYGDIKNNSKDMSTRVNLNSGEVFFEVAPQGSGSFELGTSRSLASVKGTKFGGKSTGYVWVTQGLVVVTALNSGETVSLFEKMYAQVDEDGNNVESGTLTEDEIAQLNSGYNTLDEDLIKKTIILKFKDANGQMKEFPVTIFEKKN